MYIFLSLSSENRFALRFECLQGLNPILRAQQRLVTSSFKIEAYRDSECVNSERGLCTPDSSDSSGAREIANLAARRARGAEANVNDQVNLRDARHDIAYLQWSFQTLVLMHDPLHSRRCIRPDLSRVVVRGAVGLGAFNDLPSSSACFPVMARPVKMRSFAFDGPSKRTRRCVPPAPGMIPNFVSGKPIFVAPGPTCPRQLQIVIRQCGSRAGPAMRRSQARASSKPPPRAGPSIAAMVGTSRFSNRWSAALKSAKNLSTCTWVIVLRSTRSAPAQNEPGVDDAIISTRLGIC